MSIFKTLKTTSSYTKTYPMENIGKATDLAYMFNNMNRKISNPSKGILSVKFFKAKRRGTVVRLRARIMQIVPIDKE